MSLPNDLPGQVNHVFEPSRQRDVLVRIAERLELLTGHLFPAGTVSVEVAEPPAATLSASTWRPESITTTLSAEGEILEDVPYNVPAGGAGYRDLI